MRIFRRYTVKSYLNKLAGYSPELAPATLPTELKVQNSRRRCGAEYKNGDPWENRTPDFAVRGRRLSRLTKGPYFGEKAGFSPNKEKSRHLPIFPGRLQPSIFGTTKLNFCVRNGNRWNLGVIGTGYECA